MKQNIHVEQEFDHPVTYGLVLARNSDRLTACLRKYKSHHPHQVFEIIADKLVPISKSTQKKLRKSLEAAMVEKFFYEEHMFKMVMYALMGVFLVVMVVGVVNQYVYKQKVSLKTRATKIWTDKKSYLERKYSSARFMRQAVNKDEEETEQIEQGTGEENVAKNCCGVDSRRRSSKQLQLFVREYEEFHEKWINKVKESYGVL